MRAALLQKGQKQAKKKETPQFPPLQIEGKQLFCIAKWDTEKSNIIWQWDMVDKYIQTFSQDDSDLTISQSHYLTHKLVGTFVGSQDAIIKFLEKKNIQSQLFQPKDFLQLKDEGIYVLKISKIQSYLIIWPGQEYCQQPMQSQKFVNLAFSVTGKIILVLGISDENDIFELQYSGQKDYNLPREQQYQQQQQKQISKLQNVKICTSGTILVKQNVMQRETYSSSAEVLYFLSKAHQTKPCIRFGDAFWKPIRNYLTVDEPMKPDGQLMVLCALLPKLGLQLHETMLKGPQSLIEQLIKKIEQKCGYQSEDLYEIVNVDYDEQKGLVKMKVSQIFDTLYNVICLSRESPHSFMLPMDLLEVFWIEGTFFMVLKDNDSIVLCAQSKKIWKDENIYDIVVFQAQQKLLLLYSTLKKSLTVLKIMSQGGLLAGQSWTIKQEKSLNHLLVQYLAQLVDKLLDIQVMCDEQGRVITLLQTSIEVTKASLFQRSQLEIVKKPQQVNNHVLLCTPKADICLKISYEEMKWNVDILSLNPFNFEVKQTIRNIAPLKDFAQQNTSFSTYYDDSNGKQYFVAIMNNGAYDLTYIKLEIQRLKKLQPIFNAIPWENFQENQLFLATEQKSFKKLIPQQHAQYLNFCNQWDWCNLEQFQAQDHAIRRILLNSPLQSPPASQQVEVGQSISQEELQKGDSIWYCTADKAWIESEIVAQDYCNKTYAVKKTAGEEISYGESIRRRYSKQAYSSQTYGGSALSAFATYSKLINLYLDDPKGQRDLVLSEVVATFNEVCQRYTGGLLPYDCLLYLYEPFRKVTFCKNQRDLKQMLEMLDCFPTVLNLKSIQPIFQPAVDHLEMILKVFVFFVSEKFQEAQQLSGELYIKQNFADIKSIFDDCLQVINKARTFFEQNYNQLVVTDVIQNHCTQLELAENEIKNNLQKIDYYQHESYVMVDNSGSCPMNDSNVNHNENQIKSNQINQNSELPGNTLLNNSQNDKQFERTEKKQHKQTVPAALQPSVRFPDTIPQEVLEKQQLQPQNTEKKDGIDVVEEERLQLERQQQQYQQQQQQQLQNDNVNQEKRLQQENQKKDGIDASYLQKYERKSQGQQQQSQSLPQSYPLDQDYQKINGLCYFIYEGRKYPCIGGPDQLGIPIEYEFRKGEDGGQWRRKNLYKNWYDLSVFPEKDKIF